MGGTEGVAKLARGPRPTVTLRGAGAAGRKSHVGFAGLPTPGTKAPDSPCMGDNQPLALHWQVGIGLGSWSRQRPSRPKCQGTRHTPAPCSQEPHRVPTVPRLMGLTHGLLNPDTFPTGGKRQSKFLELQTTREAHVFVAHLPTPQVSCPKEEGTHPGGLCWLSCLGLGCQAGPVDAMSLWGAALHRRTWCADSPTGRCPRKHQQVQP